MKEIHLLTVVVSLSTFQLIHLNIHLRRLHQESFVAPMPSRQLMPMVKPFVAVHPNIMAIHTSAADQSASPTTNVTEAKLA